MPRIYDSVPGNHPPKNRFDLSHTHFLSAKVGLLYPVLCKEMYPGDVFKVSDAVHCQLQPMVAPLLSDLDLYAHTFFVPYRLIYGVDNLDGKSIWEKYITGGDDGDYDTPLPSWSPSWSRVGFSSETIWDSIGNPVNCTVDDSDPDSLVYTWSPVVPKDLLVSKAPKLSYNFIYNNYYRDENLQDEVDLDNEYLLYADWRKDYFTSALESQQFGTAPGMPITGTIPVTYAQGYGSVLQYPKFFPLTDPVVNFSQLRGGSVYASLAGNPQYLGYKLGAESSSSSGYGRVFVSSSEDNVPFSDISGSGNVYPLTSSPGFATLDNYAIGFNVSQMRLMFAIQRLMELSQTGGHRYTEYLQAHFGVSPSDARLDRPEYIGGCVFPINVSVSVQSSATVDGQSPQGNKVGIGNINDVQRVGSYRAEEYGLIMTLISIRPKPCYQQGISREWLRQNRFEYYSPEFANLSEQAIFRAEIYVDPTDSETPDNGIFGYQAHWNELRASQNYISGAMREQFDYWLMSRKFASRPALNADFVSLGHPSEYNRIWAVQDEDQFIIAWSNLIDAYRPLPAYGTPGLIDHVYGGL